MKKIGFVRKYSGTAFAFIALVVAQAASTQFSLIFYQSEIPNKLKH
ncbi:AgrD family cyclic lactone autoinducer peptide [Petrocella sp. FN5]|jgi:cyclic lactone autoinducer peptide|nr:cyclic lactone autoinducer peptide [Petrocella sp. FN5]MDF1618199.1 cyclic lactone autoinducer peptide [Petrocella sp. FN5]